MSKRAHSDDDDEVGPPRPPAATEGEDDDQDFGPPRPKAEPDDDDGTGLIRVFMFLCLARPCCF